jgi:hypothetical protein
LKVLILVLAWRLSKESLRNGHLHTKTLPIRVTPNRRRHGDGFETQSSPESRPISRIELEISPGLRRLRFPSFISTCQRATRRHQILSRPILTGFEDNEAPAG